MTTFPATFFRSACTSREAWVRSWQARGSSPKRCAHARSTCTDGWVAFTCWKSRSAPSPVLHGNGLRAGPAHTPRLRPARGVVVFHRPRSLPHGEEREHRSAPSMDDSQFLSNPCSCHSTRLHARHARAALVVPNNLHYRVLVVLGSQFAHRGVAGAPPARSRQNGVLIWPAFIECCGC